MLNNGPHEVHSRLKAKFAFGVVGTLILAYQISIHFGSARPIIFWSLISIFTGNLLSTINQWYASKEKNLYANYLKNEIIFHFFFIPACWIIPSPFSFIISIGLLSTIIKESQSISTASLKGNINHLFILCHSLLFGTSIVSSLINENHITLHPGIEIFILLSGLMLVFLGIRDVAGLLTTLRLSEQENSNLSQEKTWYSDLFSLVSHNIRTPLATISNEFEIQALKSTEFSSTIGFKRAQTELDKVLSIVDQSFRQNAWVKQKTRTLQEIRELIINQYPKATYTQNLPQALYNLELNSAESTALLLALDSLIGNAFKYGHGEVNISGEYMEDSSESTVIIYVQDNGDGMSQEQLKNYGTPFNSKLSKAGGTGLGVYFTKGLLEQLGWKLDATSEVGKGTTVSITLIFSKNRIQD